MYVFKNKIITKRDKLDQRKCFKVIEGELDNSSKH